RPDRVRLHRLFIRVEKMNPQPVLANIELQETPVFPLDPQTALLVSRKNSRRNSRENGQNQKQPRKEKGGLHGRRMYRRFDAWQETSRTKPLNFPSSVRLPRVAHPIMQTPRPSLPKFDARRRH